jgi:nucleosome binding factor SPN SPT16 subunit
MDDLIEKQLRICKGSVLKRGESEEVKKRSAAYENDRQVPRGEAKTHVDKKTESVGCSRLLQAPFHIEAIKSVNKGSEGDYGFLKINFAHLSVEEEARGITCCSPWSSRRSAGSEKGVERDKEIMKER